MIETKAGRWDRARISESSADHLEANQLNQRRERALYYLLCVCGGVEVLILLAIVALGPDAFIAFVSTPDTPTYLGVAQRLAISHTLTAGIRTLGYPLFLALGYFVTGRAAGPYAVVAVQLVLNIGFTWGCWKLLERMAPSVGVPARALATLFFFWAGLGMALYLMTDFLAALFFCIFLYGILFWRTGTRTAISGISLAIATLTRPTFTFFAFVLPVIAWLVGRCTTRVPLRDIVVYVACSLAATGVSVWYQYSFSNYFGPSPNMTTPIQEMIFYGIVKPQTATSDYDTFKNEFQRKIEERSGRQYAAMSPGEHDAYAKEIFREQLATHQGDLLINYAQNFLKYLFAPVESIVSRFVGLWASEEFYSRYPRVLLGLFCLPIWLLSFVPPIGASTNGKMFYLIVMVCLVYVIGLSAIGTGAGERYRFPVLPFMLPIALWNVEWCSSNFRRRGQYRSQVTAGRS